MSERVTTRTNRIILSPRESVSIVMCENWIIQSSSITPSFKVLSALEIL